MRIAREARAVPLLLMFGGCIAGICAGYATAVGLKRAFPDRMAAEHQSTVFAAVAFLVSVTILIALYELGILPSCTDSCGPAV